MVAAGRRRRGVERYDDDSASHYSWDSTVANRDAVRPGDVLVLWDSDVLLGASVIENSVIGTGSKTLGRCPNCEVSNYEPRATLKPTYKCYPCRAEFDVPVTSPQP